MRMYDMHELQEYVEKQNLMYIDLYNVLQLVKPIIEKFNGKQLNVRLKKAIQEVMPEQIYVRLGKQYDFSSEKRLSISNDNRSYKSLTGNWVYLECYEVNIYFPIDERIDSTKVLENIKMIEEGLSSKISILGKLDVFWVEKEFKDIQEKIHQFQSRLPFEIMDSFKFR